MPLGPNEINTWVEIFAFGFAAVFILVKLLGGGFNYGMGVTLTSSRSPHTSSEDLVSISIALRRHDVGRIKIQDIAIELTKGYGAKPELLRPSEREDNRPYREWREKPEGVMTNERTSKGIALPPGDATEIAYWFIAPRDKPVLVDVSILGKRTGPAAILGDPHWRVSTVVHPKPSDERIVAAVTERAVAAGP